MDQCEDKEEGVHPSKIELFGGHKSQVEAQSDVPGPEHEPGAGPGDERGLEPEAKRICVPGTATNLATHFTDLKQGDSSGRLVPQTVQTEDEPGPSSMSLSSDESMFHNIEFTSNHSSKKDNWQNFDIPIDQSDRQDQTQLDSIFMLLEDTIVAFVRNELKIFQRFLSSDGQELIENQQENEELFEGDDEEKRSSKKALLKITVNFLRRMKQEKLAVHLQSSKILFFMMNQPGQKPKHRHK